MIKIRAYNGHYCSLHNNQFDFTDNFSDNFTREILKCGKLPCRCAVRAETRPHHICAYKSNPKIIALSTVGSRRSYASKFKLNNDTRIKFDFRIFPQCRIQDFQCHIKDKLWALVQFVPPIFTFLGQKFFFAKTHINGIPSSHRVPLCKNFSI